MEKKTFQKGFYLSSSSIIMLFLEVTPFSSSIDDDPCSPELKNVSSTSSCPSIEIPPSSVNNLWSPVLKNTKIITYQYMQPLSRYIKTSPISIKSTQ